jgi:hypothetical protein
LYQDLKQFVKQNLRIINCFYTFIVNSFSKIQGKEMQHSLISENLIVKRKEIAYQRKTLKVTQTKTLDLKPNKEWKKEQTRQQLFKRKLFKIEKFQASVTPSNDVSPMIGVDFYGDQMQLESTPTSQSSL